MKAAFFIITWVIVPLAYSQQTEQYYDIDWKLTDPSQARYYTVTQKKDSVWYRKNYHLNQKRLIMEGYYKDAECKMQDGLFTSYYHNGMLRSRGYYKNGKRDGLWVSYYPDGMMYDSVTYYVGEETGLRLRWHRNGFLSDSIVTAADGSGVQVSWFDNGNPSAAGFLAPGKKQTGKWKYFHRNGKVSAVEVFDNGKLQARQYFTEEGTPVADTSNRDCISEFIGGEKKWQQHLNRNLYFPSQWRFKTPGNQVVIIGFEIDEEGNVQHAEVINSFHPDFDKIALETIKKSPKWTPAIDHNRNVRSYKRQPITFRHD